jgi:hypothetical protein
MPDNGSNTKSGRNSDGLMRETIHETVNRKLLLGNVRTRNGMYAKPSWSWADCAAKYAPATLDQ